MAQRRFAQFRNSLEAAIVELWAVVDVSGTTPVLKQWNGQSGTYTTAPTGGYGGIKSVTRSAAGKWVVSFGSASALNPVDTYRRILDVEATTYNATGVPTALVAGVLSGGSDTNVQSATAPKATIQFVKAGAATGTASIPAANLNGALTGGTTLPFVSAVAGTTSAPAVTASAADPADGDRIILRITLQNTSAVLS